MNVDKLIADHCGGICPVRIRKNTWEDIHVGNRFWSYGHDMLSQKQEEEGLPSGREHWHLITITHIRSGVVFYTQKDSPEEHFEKGSAMVGLLEPETYIHKLDPQYYRMESRSGLVDFKYDPNAGAPPNLQSPLEVRLD